MSGRGEGNYVCPMTRIKTQPSPFSLEISLFLTPARFGACTCLFQMQEQGSTLSPLSLSLAQRSEYSQPWLSGPPHLSGFRAPPYKMVKGLKYPGGTHGHNTSPPSFPRHIKYFIIQRSGGRESLLLQFLLRWGLILSVKTVPLS